jgi:beta-glucanase (GH16 family)
MRILALITSGAIALTSAGFANGFEDRFDTLNPQSWSVANYTFGHPYFDTDWGAKQLSANAGLTLKLTPQKGHENAYIGASLRRHKPTGFGRYEVTVQAARGPGVITGFFTYTGPHYGTRHDEIDIEFLGKNTRQIHIATFVDGKMWNKFIDLDFDAADKPRSYAFEWDQNSVRWYVGDKMIYRRQAKDGAIPSEPSMLFANIWAADPSIKAWSGVTAKGTNATAKILRMGFEPKRDDLGS